MRFGSRTAAAAAAGLATSRRCQSTAPSASPVFKQLFDPASFTFTYLLGCTETKECLLIGAC